MEYYRSPPSPLLLVTRKCRVSKFRGEYVPPSFLFSHFYVYLRVNRLSPPSFSGGRALLLTVQDAKRRLSPSFKTEVSPFFLSQIATRGRGVDSFPCPYQHQKSWLNFPFFLSASNFCDLEDGSTSPSFSSLL